MKTWLAGILGVAIFASGAGLCFGQEGKDKKRQEKENAALEAEFKKLDTGGNGTLYLAEFVGDKTGEEKAKAEKSFRRKDKDKDLQLTLAEFKAPEKPPAKKKDKPKKKK